MREEKTKKEKFLEAMELPLELLVDAPRITLFGNKNLLAENYKGIVEYDETIVRFINHISIVGTDLHIEEINSDEIFLTGNISNIEFE